VTAERPKRLGRGLEALIGGAAGASGPISDLQRIPIGRVRPNPFQPRREFNAEDLAELEASLKSSGLLQPITVRRRGDVFELIAGERRTRAATNLGWSEITAIVRDFDDRTMLVLALVENLQRTNLNPLEEARGYRRLLDEFELTQQQVADAVGKDRTTITNLLRVLTLPEHIQRLVENGSFSLGHARALLSLDSEEAATRLATEAVAARLSVRELEQRARELSSKTRPDGRPSRQSSPASTGASADPALRRIEDDLRRYLQTDVRVQLSGESKGKIEVAFYSGDDLDRVLDLILRDARRDF
jgi:ParB family transcriptional regulator, chromosome partitioning protein